MNGTVHDGCTSARDDLAIEETPIFNSRACRAAFRSDQATYMDAFGLTEPQKQAVRHLSVAEPIEAGGNIYYLAKLAAIYGLGVQDIGAQQTGMSVPAFKAMLLGAAS